MGDLVHKRGSRDLLSICATDRTIFPFSPYRRTRTIQYWSLWLISFWAIECNYSKVDSVHPLTYDEFDNVSVRVDGLASLTLVGCLCIYCCNRNGWNRIPLSSVLWLQKQKTIDKSSQIMTIFFMWYPHVSAIRVNDVCENISCLHFPRVSV